MWEFDPENHLLMPLLEMSRDFVVGIPSGGLFPREAMVQVVSSRFWLGQFLSRVVKIKEQSSQSGHVERINWSELINVFVH